MKYKLYICDPQDVIVAVIESDSKLKCRNKADELYSHEVYGSTFEEVELEVSDDVVYIIA